MTFFLRALFQTHFFLSRTRTFSNSNITSHLCEPDPSHVSHVHSCSIINDGKLFGKNLSTGFDGQNFTGRSFLQSLVRTMVRFLSRNWKSSWPLANSSLNCSSLILFSAMGLLQKELSMSENRLFELLSVKAAPVVIKQLTLRMMIIQIDFKWDYMVVKHDYNVFYFSFIKKHC